MVPPPPVSTDAKFPPPPLTEAKEASIMRECIAAMQPSSFQEAGCTVCGQLTLLRNLSESRHVARLLSILENDTCTRKERFADTDPVGPHPGPVRDTTTDFVCLKCRAAIRKGNVPKLALVNNMWIGEVLDVLAQLSFVERLLVACMQHSCCFMRVVLAGHPDSGARKMIAHVVVFESPISKVYN
ncbi:hypothetical protein IW261DRAFT_1335545, partial [Armillaria novae-zelandiae]